MHMYKHFVLFTQISKDNFSYFASPEPSVSKTIVHNIDNLYFRNYN